MRLLSVFVVVSLLGASDLLIAHGGGLDGRGCHNNRKTGDYHCHRGNSKLEPSLNTNPNPKRIYEQKPSKPVAPYDRDLYGYKSYPAYSSKGFYTGQTCDTNIDHVVSLKDAHESGASRWTITERITFANDRLNHVPSCSRVNSSKGSSTPSNFFRKSNDGRGMDYEIKTKCAYLGIYYQVKRKYQLSLSNNNPGLFATCGLDIL